MRYCIAAGIAFFNLLCLAPARAGVILQYFESKWETIEHRMPDIFMAGYSAMWLPPPGRADTGGQSVGYDVYDRFDLGHADSPTAYGTRDKLVSLIAESHRAGLSVFTDLILNHNGFRDHNTPGFETSGGYPGFAVTLGGDPYGDFHNPSGSDRLTMRLSGLIDIAQEKNYQYIRHPVESDPQNLPFKPIKPENHALYPDFDLPANSLGVHPFNLNDPMQGDPYLENATGVLLRHTQWMVDVIGVDGFRIDAAKHIPEWFFTSFFDNVVWQRGRPLLDGAPTTPFSFCEVYDGSQSLVAGYIRKDGFGNRDALDFPLFFALGSQLNSNGFGSWTGIVSSTIDASDGSTTDGSRGVSFVSSHDQAAPSDDNLAYAYILTKPGYPLVYYNAKQFGTRSFPKDGRGDALGGQFGDLITNLVDVHNSYVRDTYIQRAIDADVLVYERSNMLLIGLNDNQDISTTRYDQRNVLTGFDAGTRLRELTGNAADPNIDPSDQIADVLVVGADKRVNIRVPRNINRKGFVAYGPAKPQGVLALTPGAGTIPADDVSVPEGQRRLTAVPIVAQNNLAVTLQTSDPDPLDPDKDDNALFRIDEGGDFNGNGVIDSLTGLLPGFENFLTSKSPLHGGGTGAYVQNIDASGLDEGYHYLQAVAFRHRTGGSPIFETFRLPFYLDRQPPLVTLAAPTQTGNNDITTTTFKVKVLRADRTATRVHVIFDQPLNADVLPLVNSGNKMSRADLNEFRFTWTQVVSGNHTVAVVAYEDSGNVSVTRYAGINARTGYGAGPGDVNRDGALDFFDIDAFVDVVLSGAFDPTADINGDGYVDFFDIDVFVACLLNGGC